MIKRTLMIVSAVALLAACGKKVEEQPAQQPDANPVATVPTPANEAAAPDFVEKAAISDMYEIESSKVALARSKNAEVKKFAQMMIDAHTKSTADLKTAITTAGLTLTPPAGLDDAHKGKIEDLNKAEAKDFDLKYLNDQVDGHQAALDLVQRYANDGDQAAIKTFATALAPAVQHHYDEVKALRDKLDAAK